MNQHFPTMQASNRTQEHGMNRTWGILAIVWFLLIAFVPDPRPLATPYWSIKAVRAALVVQEPAARVIAAVALRMFMLGLLGLLMMLASRSRRFDRRGVVTLVLAPLAAIAALWIDHGYFPITAQLKLTIVAALAGALLGLLLRRNWPAGGVLLLLLGYTGYSLARYSVSDDLAQATRAQVKHLIATAPSAPDGDDGFIALTRAAFARAHDRSNGGDPVLEDQAAVLALALVLGDEKLANVAGRYTDPAAVRQCEALRTRITAHGRADWSRHFWVSAGLVVLSGESRSLNVGILKELKDANAGGSGFSFGDLTADAAGDRFALAATQDVAAAVAMQARIAGAFTMADLIPDPTGLPEGIHANEFEDRYGGAGGALTDSIVQVIEARIATCPLLTGP